MRLICDCGNEHEFIKGNSMCDEGDIEKGFSYVCGAKSFNIYQLDHEMIGIKCCKCGEAIWMFV